MNKRSSSCASMASTSPRASFWAARAHSICVTNGARRAAPEPCIGGSSPPGQSRCRRQAVLLGALPGHGSSGVDQFSRRRVTADRVAARTAANLPQARLWKQVWRRYSPCR